MGLRTAVVEPTIVKSADPLNVLERARATGLSETQMRAILVRGELGGADLSGLFATVGAEVQSATSYAFGSTRVVLIVGRKFFLRTNDRLGLVVVAASDGAVQRIDLSYAGGGSGLIGNFLYGAGDSLEAQLLDALVQLLSSRSLSYGEVPPPGPEAGRPLP